MKNFWIEGANVHLGTRAGAELVAAIDKAKKSILVCSPYISPEFLQESIDKDEAGIKIQMITSPRDMQKSLDIYNYLIKNDILRVIKYFDIENRGQDDFNWLHTKFFIIDNCKLFLGSLNFTKSGIHKNHEVVINTKDTCAITQFTKEFEWLWNNDIAQYA